MSTKADELNALADRCEREEASRVLDRAIASTLGYQVEVIEIPEGHPMADVFKAGSGLEFMYRPGCDREGIPPWTRFLDAAVTLVPEGWTWLRKGKHAMTCAFEPTNEKDWGTHIDGGGQTAALALCAAALRARATLSQTDAEEAK